MMRLALALALALGSVAAEAAPKGPKLDAAQYKKARSYTVQKGDTCMGIALKLYGTRRGIDVIHAYNRLGPIPHHLRAGLVLKCPALPDADKMPVEPDARLTFFRNDVDTYTPGRHHGVKDEDLHRGNRVATLDSSTAEVTFRDESQLQLGQDTLIVILGDESSLAKRSTVGDTTLVKGTLRAHLGELAGGEKRPPLVVAAPTGAKMTMEPGHAQFSVDAKKTARLSVYQGSARLRHKGKEVTVAAGMGAKAEADKPPTVPKPLPPAPAWRERPADLVMTAGAPVEVSAKYGAAATATRPVKWHVELARDAAFNDLVVDAKVPAAVDKLDAKQLAPGQYFARVAAVDADEFEGAPSEVATVRVAKYTVVAASPGHRARVEVEPGVDCFLVGSDGLELTPGVAHELACSLKKGEAPSVRLTVPPDAAGVPSLRHELGSVERGSDGTGWRTLAVTVLDAVGAPVRLPARVRADAPATVDAVAFDDEHKGVPVEPVTRATVRWPANATRIALHVEAGGAREDFDFAPPAAPPPTPTPVAARTWRVELAPFASLRASPDAGVGYGGGVEAGVAVDKPWGQAAAALRAGYERYGYSTGCGPGGEFCAPGQSSVTLGEDVLALGLDLAYRLHRRDARWTPYASLEPLVTFARVSPDAASSPLRAVDRTRLGIGLVVGADLRAGPGRLFLEVGGRYVAPQTLDTGDVSLAGFVANLGYRFSL